MYPVTNWSVYALVDPRYLPSHLSTRYIGVSRDPKRRIVDHLDEVINGLCSNPRKKNWISELVNLGLEPVLKILDSGYGLDWEESEIDHIWLYRNVFKCDLLNITHGGEGRLGACHSQETKLKISNSARLNPGLRYLEEWKRRQSVAQTGQKRSVETKIRVGLSHVGLKYPESGVKIQRSIVRKVKNLIANHDLDLCEMDYEYVRRSFFPKGTPTWKTALKYLDNEAAE